MSRFSNINIDNLNNMFIEIFKQKQEKPMLNKNHKFNFLKIIIIIPNNH